MGRVESAMESGVVAATIVMVSGLLAVCTGLLESVAFAWKVEVPAAVGVPLTTQPVSVRPAGSVPLTSEHAYGAVPPVTGMVAL